jgi:pre-mRNA-processing factor 19
MAAGAGVSDMDTESKQADEIPAAVIAGIVSLSKKLSKGRKKRDMPADLATKEAIAEWQPKSSHTPHLSSKPGITCVDIHPDQNQFATGGVDLTVKVFDRAAGKVSTTLKGHSKRVNSVHFLPQQGDSMLTTSADKTVKLWSAGKCAATLSHHTADVVGAAVHASGAYAVSASADGSWAFVDLAAATVLRHVKEEESSVFTCLNFHPDGLILGTGTADHAIKIWDTTSQKSVANCQGHTGAVNSVVFSENGYYMASGSADGNVKLWDLRKLKNFRTLEMGGSVLSVDFDSSGSYFAAAGQDIRVFGTKSWDGLTTLGAHTADVTSVRFGASASFLVSTSMDRSLKFYN